MKERLAEGITKEVIRVEDIDLTDPKDPVSEFVLRLKETEKNLKEPLSWVVSHGRRRKISNMSIARAQRESQLRTTQAALQMIENLDFSEATFFKNEGGKIVGFKVDNNLQD